MTENLTQMQNTTALVTAATGKTGRRVTDRLRALGLTVRAGSRRGEVRFDWEDDSTWAAALRGADAAYVAYYPDLAAPGADGAMRTFGRLAERAGVDRLVLLSGRGEPEAAAAESALRESGVPLTVVRGSFFAQNFSEGLMYEGVRAGEFAFPAGEAAEPFVDADDLADVVVAALTGDAFAGETLELTGPRLVGFAEAAEELARATGRTVRYRPVSGEEYAAVLGGYGFPEAEARWVADLFTSLLDGHNASLTNDVKRVLGREPKDFTAFAEDAARAGAWSV
ncbi:NAD(P)H-binding protein [Streptomyces sp. HNM0663]|uniref:NAD(P)H-binding protein n=1 Tax=Streptomyces chengmaiensis TaxID=3040919 RepID=A0ABT6HYY4_9ACTN|nr:NAD(P)H-binding protein [Streptomyces chengmaiensis]MDH2393923.1 NAD(P)H-binding protein [Streptomyces chengmaiensis]